jgi:DNA-binding protein H-NS
MSAKSAGRIPTREDLEALSLDQLLEVNETIQQLVDQRAEAAREAAWATLRGLENYEQRGKRRKAKKPQQSKGLKLLPKYRNPANPKQSWAGRGKTPRWMRDALKAGRSKDDFRI